VSEIYDLKVVKLVEEKLFLFCIRSTNRSSTVSSKVHEYWILLLFKKTIAFNMALGRHDHSRAIILSELQVVHDERGDEVVDQVR